MPVTEPQAVALLRKETLTQVSTCEFCNFLRTFFVEHL